MTFLPYSKRAAHHKISAIGAQLLQLMDSKKTNLALSADVTSAEALLTLADQLGPEICILKTHIDIIQDFNLDLIRQLRKLADRHGFYIFEDRKFADIGQTVKQQYSGGIFQIAKWADIINAHTLPGAHMVQGLMEAATDNKRGLLLIAQMSANENLITQQYIQQTLAIAAQFPQFVMGFIAREALSDHPQWITMTPGISLDQRGDALGQQYLTPENAIMENGTDVIIVGRGILASKNPLMAASDYRARGWQAYLNRIS